MRPGDQCCRWRITGDYGTRGDHGVLADGHAHASFRYDRKPGLNVAAMANTSTGLLPKLTNDLLDEHA